MDRDEETDGEGCWQLLGKQGTTTTRSDFNLHRSSSMIQATPPTLKFGEELPSPRLWSKFNL